MATRGRQKLNASLSKAELEKLEKEAEAKGKTRREANREKSKEEMRKRTQGDRVTRRQGRARRKIPAQVREMMISKEQDAKNKAAEQKKPTRRQAVQARREAVRAGDANLRTENRRGASKKTVDQAIKTATDKAKPTVSSASKLGKLARGAKALSVAGLGLNVADVGADSDFVPSKQTERGKRQLGAAKEAAIKTMSKNTERDAKTNQAKRVAERNALKNMADKKRVDAATKANKTDNQRKSLEQDKKRADAATTAHKAAGEPRSIAEARAKGKDYFIGKDGKKKAAVTREELDKSGLSLREYLNKKKGATTKMAKGGYANCGASVKPNRMSKS